MNVYVAASSRELERAERMMRLLALDGHVITHNWIPSVRAAIASGISEAKADDAHAYDAARADMDGVAAADALVFLAPTDTSKMAWSELGGALMRGIPCLVAHDIEERRNQSVVTRLAAVRCSDDEVLRELAMLEERMT